MNIVDEGDEEITLKNVCCTCLSFDRKLTQLCKVDNGVNNLFFFYSYKSDTETMLCKDVTQLFICWECTALMRRLCKFRNQACIAQRQLSDIADGKISNSLKIKCLSKLSNIHQEIYNIEIIPNHTMADNFIDCGPLIDDIKAEEGADDIPLSELKDFECTYEPEEETAYIENSDKKYKTIKHELKCMSENNYKMIPISEKEYFESIEQRRSEESYLNALLKCESCVEGFKDSEELEKHNLQLHKLRPKHTQCDICKVYVKTKLLKEHRNEHNHKYQCEVCTETFYRLVDITKHYNSEHLLVPISPNSGLLKKVKQKSLKIGLKSIKRLKTSNKKKTDDTTPLGYLCPECGKRFENKNQRYKHIQKNHREGFKCTTCGKSFPFKNRLKMHELIHGTPLPREQCPVCGKMIRKDLVKSHAKIHTERKSFSCVSCDKRFVSRSSYENHLKYTRSHADQHIQKFKCSMCDKNYRSPGELRDHVNYQHMGKTRHKCPICDKALATPRSITRHIRRAHHGVKENARDKICQTCGKAFRYKKCLREHELIHTGERPLSCELCGRTFRQSASLYTHKRRVHKMALKQRVVEHTNDTTDITKEILINEEINEKTN